MAAAVLWAAGRGVGDPTGSRTAAITHGELDGNDHPGVVLIL